MSDKWMLAGMGAAIERARQQAGLSAVQLSDRTREIGLPIHRVAVGKMESGEREPTISELIVLARALDVPPLQLIYPDLPDGTVEAWPGHETRSTLAAQWFSGELPAYRAGDEPTTDDGERQHRQDQNQAPTRWARYLARDNDALETTRMQLVMMTPDERSASRDRAEAFELAVAKLSEQLAQTAARALDAGYTVDVTRYDEKVRARLAALREG